MAEPIYPSDLTDREWAVLAPLLPPPKPGGRPRTTDLRAVLNAIFYMLRTGIPWRYLPKDFPPWSTVYHYFRIWRQEGVWEQIMDTLREIHRQQSGRPPSPSAVILDSQSVKTTERGGRRAPTPARKSMAGNAGFWWTRREPS